MANLLENFIQESLDLLDNAENIILLLEKDFLGKTVKELPENKRENIHSLFRAIHTIKGNSGIFNFEKIKLLSHNLENVLSKLRNGEIPVTKDLIDLSLLVIDRLREIIKNSENQEKISIDDLLLETRKFLGFEEKKSNGGDKKIQNAFERIFEYLVNRNIEKKSELHFYILSLPPDVTLLHYLQKLEELRKQYVFFHHSLFYVETILDEYAYWLTDKSIREEDLPYPVAYYRIYNKEIEKQKKTLQDTSFFEQDAFLKVPANLIEELINLAGESIIARNELLQKLSTVYRDDRDLWNSGKKIGQLITLLQEKLMRLRLQELNVLFERVPRIVRELAKETGKEIELEIEGGNIELDKTLIDAIKDPLVHIIRNSIDHGIETPEERERLQKPKKGKIEIKAFFQGGNVIITVSDDGRGIDTGKVLRKAIEKNILSPYDAEKLSKKEIIDLIFLPGFSTAEKVTERSGRGVGMDVVRNALRSIKGFVDIVTDAGKGTTIILTIPQTLSIITCLIVQIFDRRYAIPQNQIREILLLKKEYLYVLQGSLVYELRGKIIPVIDPYFLVKSNYRNQDALFSKREYPYLVFLETDQHVYGLLTHDIISPEELMMKSLGDDFQEIPYYAGGTILGDGDTILIFDVLGIAKSFRIQPNRHDIDTLEDTGKRTSFNPHLIFEIDGNFYGIPVERKPRIIEIQSHALEKLLHYYGFKYQNQIIPILDLNSILGLESKTILFERKSLYGIIIKNEVDDILALQATNILNITDSFEGFTKEKQQDYIIESYAIHDNKTVFIVNVDNLFSYWKSQKH